jgi:hypothetical protein
MDQSLFDIPLWLQIVFQNIHDYQTCGLLRMTIKPFSSLNILQHIDFTAATECQKIGGYHTNKDFILIANTSQDGLKLYDYYNNMFHSSTIFLKKIENRNIINYKCRQSF